VRNARRAEEAGFDFAAISDHYFPWLEEQGHSPFAWSVLGAIAQASKLGLMTAVTCPILRYHPAIIAQATATMSLLAGEHFTLGVGAGERLNEHVVGQGWPGVVERHERLAEALDIIQGLLGGKLTTFRGRYFQLDHAKLFDRPRRKPAVIMAAGGPEAARLAAEKADGLIVTEAKKELLEAFAVAAARARSTPKSACAAPPTRRRRARRPTATSGGRCRAGRYWPNCRTTKPLPPPHNTFPWRRWARR
jgi:G6PDH family F420-dependent oxidoreductase